jgi:hypothetical protein
MPADGSNELVPIGNSGILADSLTKLQWQHELAPEALEWKDAKEYCRTLILGPRAVPWRLPTAIELLSVAGDPSLPAADGGIMLWSASADATQSYSAWVIRPGDQVPSTAPTYGSAAVRCVLRSPLPQGDHYSVGADTVLDQRTLLVWQRANAPSKMTLGDASTYCQGLGLVGYSSGWRLPSLRELRTLIDWSTSKPAIDAVAFPNTPSEPFWSEVSSAGVSSVTFEDGASIDAPNTDLLYVRCVH